MYKPTMETLLRLIATNKMRVATESDHPFFYGPDVYVVDDHDCQILFGMEDGQIGIFVNAGEGSTDMDLEISRLFEDYEETITVGDVTADIVVSGGYAIAQIDGEDAVRCSMDDDVVEVLTGLLKTLLKGA